MSIKNYSASCDEPQNHFEVTRKKKKGPSPLILALCLIISVPLWSPFAIWLFISGTSMLGTVGSAVLGTQEVNVENLLIQAKGEKYYWLPDGSRWSSFSAMNMRHPKIRAREAAILKLAEFKPLPQNARNELVTLLQTEGDFDSGDGIYASRTAICYTLGRSADDWGAYQAMLDLLRKRALNPKLDANSDIKWFDDKFGAHRGSSTGPGAIVQGLLFAPAEHREKITLELSNLLQELNSAAVSSNWAKDQIKKGLMRLDEKESTFEVYQELDVERFFYNTWK